MCKLRVHVLLAGWCFFQSRHIKSLSEWRREAAAKGAYYYSWREAAYTTHGAKGHNYSTCVLPPTRLRLLVFAATAPRACSSRAAVHSLKVGKRKLEAALLCRKARLIVRNTGTGLGVVFRKRDLSWGNNAVLIITVALNAPSLGTSRSSPSTAGRCRTWCFGPVNKPK